MPRSVSIKNTQKTSTFLKVRPSFLSVDFLIVFLLILGVFFFLLFCIHSALLIRWYEPQFVELQKAVQATLFSKHQYTLTAGACGLAAFIQTKIFLVSLSYGGSSVKEAFLLSPDMLDMLFTCASVLSFLLFFCPLASIFAHIATPFVQDMWVCVKSGFARIFLNYHALHDNQKMCVWVCAVVVVLIISWCCGDPALCAPDVWTQTESLGGAAGGDGPPGGNNPGRLPLPVDLPDNNLTRWQEFMLALAKAAPALTHTLGGLLISTISGGISIVVAGGTLHLIAVNCADFDVFTFAKNANRVLLTAHTAFLALMTNSETVVTIGLEGLAVATQGVAKVSEGVAVASEAGATLSRMGEMAAQWNHLGVQIIDHLTRVSISTTDIIQTGGDVIYQLFTQGGVTVLVASGAGLAGSMVFVMLRPQQVAEIMLRLARRG